MFFAITMLVADGMTEAFAAAKSAHDAFRISLSNRVVRADLLTGESGASLGLHHIIEVDSFESAAMVVEGDHNSC